MRAIGSDYQLKELDLNRRALEHVIPPHYNEDYPKFVEFLEGYFQYLKETEGFGDFVSKLKNISDPDLVDETLLEDLKQQYGPGFPNLTAIDERMLIRIFEYWYRSKGTEEGILAYFRLFLNNDAEVIYPKDNMLRLSAGDWSETEERYTSNKGHLSEVTQVLQDSFYYQIFSYVIKSGLSIKDWGPTYSRLAHLAGWVYFGEVELKETAYFNFDTFSPTIQPGFQTRDSNILIIGAAIYAMGVPFHKIHKILQDQYSLAPGELLTLQDVAINLLNTTYTVNDLSAFTIEQLSPPINATIPFKNKYHPARIIISTS